MIRKGTIRIEGTDGITNEILELTEWSHGQAEAYFLTNGIRMIFGSGCHLVNCVL